MGNFENAVEAYCLYDSIVIGKGAQAAPGWRQSYAAFGALATHPLFNVRNMGETHIAYCNLETKDSMPFVFHLRSIGLSFAAPPHCDKGEAPSKLQAIEDLLFAQVLPRHCGLKLTVRQDDKLLHTCEAAPEGLGPYGTGLVAVADSQSTALTQGVPDIGNRWTFPELISIPRGATYRVNLELSPYAQLLLQAMAGPTGWDIDGVADPLTAVATIRCSLFGVREVQQRNALHA